ncbi:hypothetical protein JTB14_015431 [Gonioctena quinquepunctata]|nr:hypothetical protein JTB14_015431 [Gonioctena quinquepunctata]
MVGNILNDDIVPEEFGNFLNSIYSNKPSRYLLNEVGDQVAITDKILQLNVVSELDFKRAAGKLITKKSSDLDQIPLNIIEETADWLKSHL